MTESSENAETKSRRIFSAVREREFEGVPFLETRVLAALRERRAARTERALRVWKFASALSTSVSLALLAWVVLPGRASTALSAPVDRAVVVRVELAELPVLARIDRVRVDLPSGVHFYSRDHRELSEESSVLVSAEAIRAATRGKRYLPIAIQSGQEGSKPILVRFLDADSAVIGEKLIDVRFVKGA